VRGIEAAIEGDMTAERIGSRMKPGGGFGRLRSGVQPDI
jgi:hypothetical protein